MCCTGCRTAMGCCRRMAPSRPQPLGRQGQVRSCALPSQSYQSKYRTNAAEQSSTSHGILACKAKGRQVAFSCGKHTMLFFACSRCLAALVQDAALKRSTLSRFLHPCRLCHYCRTKHAASPGPACVRAGQSGYAIHPIPVSDIRALRKHTPRFGGHWLAITLVSGITLPPFHFQGKSGVHALLETLSQVRSFGSAPWEHIRVQACCFCRACRIRMLHGAAQTMQPAVRSTHTQPAEALCISLLQAIRPYHNHAACNYTTT